MQDRTSPSSPGPEAFRSARLFEEGLGHVIIARFKSGGTMVEAGVFLVDAWCLGVKNAFFTRTSLIDYRDRLLAKIAEITTLEPIEPSCGRKLVEEAAQYARQLGFAPHPDFKAACRVLGGIAAADCATSFTFGHEGKPHYIRGPSESEAQAEQIIEHLRRRCGEGGFQFMTVLGNPSFD